MLKTEPQPAVTSTG